MVTPEVGEHRHREAGAVDPVHARGRARRPPWPRPACPRRPARPGAACSSGASGVVNEPVSVPITPVGQPARSRIAASRWVVVVLPFVPVTPTIVSRPDGWPPERGGDGPDRQPGVGHDQLGHRRRRAGRSRRWSTRSADAPAATASGAKRWPSTCSPRMQQYRSRGATTRESRAIPATTVAPSPTSLTGTTGVPSTNVATVISAVTTADRSRGVGSDGAGVAARRRRDLQAAQRLTAPRRRTTAPPPARRSARPSRAARRSRPGW